MKRVINLALLMVFLSSSVTSSFAKYEITPSISIREEYDDNIFLTAENEEDDFITTFFPQILFTYSPGKFLDLNLNYGLRYKFYRDNDGFNDTSIKEIQIAALEAQVRPAERVRIDISDIYKQVPIDVRRRIAPESTLVNKTYSNTFTISPSIELPITSTITATTGYGYSNIWYDVPEAQDYYSHSAFFTLNKRFSSRMSGELRYNYYAYRVDVEQVFIPLDDYDRHQGSVAVEYQISPHFSIDGEIGEAKFDFKATDDTNDTFYNVSAQYRTDPSESTIARVYYSTTFLDATTQGTYRRRDTGLIYRTDRPVVLDINPYYTTDKFLDGTGREDRSTGVDASASRSLTGKIDLSLNGGWRREDHTNILVNQNIQALEDEDVKAYHIGCELIYRFNRNITASIGYRYAKRNSDIDINDFKNNNVWIEANLSF